MSGIGREKDWYKRTKATTKLNVAKSEWDKINQYILANQDKFAIPLDTPFKIDRETELDNGKHSFLVIPIEGESGYKIGALSRSTVDEGIEGHGGFGVTKIIQWQDGTQDAVKITAANKAFKNEAEILQEAMGKDKVVVFTRDRKNKTQWIGEGTIKDKTYVIQPLFDGGDIWQYLGKNPAKKMPMKQKLDLAIAIAKSIKDLHDKNILHNDIKPENLMLTKAMNDEHSFLVTAIDFGLSNKLKEGKDFAEDGLKYTRGYAAPEIENATEDDIKNGKVLYSKATDMYALGKLLSVDLGLDAECITKLTSKAPADRPTVDKLIENLQKLRVTEEKKVLAYIDSYLKSKYSKAQKAIAADIKLILTEYFTNTGSDPNQVADNLLEQLIKKQQLNDKGITLAPSVFNLEVLRQLPDELQNSCLQKLEVHDKDKEQLLHDKPNVTSFGKYILANTLRAYNQSPGTKPILRTTASSSSIPLQSSTIGSPTPAGAGFTIANSNSTSKAAMTPAYIAPISLSDKIQQQATTDFTCKTETAPPPSRFLGRKMSAPKKEQPITIFDKTNNQLLSTITPKGQDTLQMECSKTLKDKALVDQAKLIINALLDGKADCKINLSFMGDRDEAQTKELATAVMKDLQARNIEFTLDAGKPALSAPLKSALEQIAQDIRSSRATNVSGLNFT